MKRQKITFMNNFHNTSVTLNLELLDDELQEPDSTSYSMRAHQYRRYWRELCGIKGCTCMGNRGNLKPSHRVEWTLHENGEFIMEVFD